MLKVGLFLTPFDLAQVSREGNNLLLMYIRGNKSSGFQIRSDSNCRVRNKQLPTCPSRVKFGGGNLILLKGCPQDNLKFSKKCLISSFLDELKYKFKAMTVGLYL